MNQNQQKQVERIFGKNYTENDIPAIWRKEQKEDEEYAEQCDWETLRNYQESVRDKGRQIKK